MRLLARNERYAELGLLILNKVDLYVLCLILTLIYCADYLQDDCKQTGKLSMNVKKNEMMQLSIVGCV